MSLTKIKVFKFTILHEGLDLELEIEKIINNFFANVNNIYVDHSAIVLYSDKDVNGKVRIAKKEIIVNIIYKDLNVKDLSITKVSKKVQAVVKKEIEEEKINSPNVQTGFDKKADGFKKKIKQIDPPF